MYVPQSKGKQELVPCERQEPQNGKISSCHVTKLSRLQSSERWRVLWRIYTHSEGRRNAFSPASTTDILAYVPPKCRNIFFSSQWRRVPQEGNLRSTQLSSTRPTNVVTDCAKMKLLGTHSNGAEVLGLAGWQALVNALMNLRVP